MEQPLMPTKILEVEGKMFYSESDQAWNTIRFRSEILNEFPQLKQKRSKFKYKMKYFRTFEEFEKEIKELMEKGEFMPVLLFLYKEL